MADATIQDYLHARKQAVEVAIAVMEKNPDGKGSSKVLEPVQKQLEQLIGPIDVKGFPKQGKGSFLVNPPGELPDGGVDAVQAQSFDGKTRLTVTTVPLLRNYLIDTAHRLHGNRCDRDLQNGAKTDLRNVLGAESFYNVSGILGSEADYYRFADLPVTTPDGQTFAKATLLGGTQDTLPRMPDTLAVTVMKGTRVHILTESVHVREIPACKTAYMGAESVNEVTDVEQEEVVDNNKVQKFWQCFAHNLSTQREYPELVRQAQALVDRVLRP